MQAIYLHGPQSAALGQTAEPTLGHGQVRLRVAMVGLCGSDLNSFRGKNPLVTYPRIPGHEISATILELGPDVPHQFKPGAPVAVSPYTNCGKCPSCRRGRFNACQFNQTLGVQRDGALTEQIVVPWQRLVVSSILTLRELCLVEPLTVGFHSVSRGRVAGNEWVAVLGCGTVGLGAIACASSRGAHVIAVDLDDGKLELAKQAGASHIIHSKNEPVLERLRELTGGEGPDVIIEAIGLPDTFRLAVEAVAFTGRVVYIGYAKEHVSYDTRLFVQKELDILGSRNATVDDFAAVVKVLEARQFPLDATVSHVVPLAATPEALANWDRDPASVRKILIEVQT